MQVLRAPPPPRLLHVRPPPLVFPRLLHTCPLLLPIWTKINPLPVPSFPSPLLAEAFETKLLLSSPKCSPSSPSPSSSLQTRHSYPVSLISYCQWLRSSNPRFVCHSCPILHHSTLVCYHSVCYPCCILDICLLSLLRSSVSVCFPDSSSPTACLAPERLGRTPLDQPSSPANRGIKYHSNLLHRIPSR